MTERRFKWTRSAAVSRFTTSLRFTRPSSTWTRRRTSCTWHRPAWAVSHDRGCRRELHSGRHARDEELVHGVSQVRPEGAAEAGDGGSKKEELVHGVSQVRPEGA